MYEYKSFQAGQMFLWDAQGDNELFEKRDFHCHKECEIFYMINGEMQIWLEGTLYHITSDNLLLIPSNYFHQWKIPGGKICRRISIHFLPEMFAATEGDFFLNLFSEPVLLMNGSRHDLNFYVRSIAQCAAMETSVQKIAAKIRLSSLLSQIYHLRSGKAAKPVILDERLRKVIVYLENNLRGEISLNDLSNRFGIAKDYLNRLFHKTIGTPIMKYITVKRLGLAEQEILLGARLSEAAYRAGFNNYTSFFRAYKSFYGSAPSEFSGRKQ